MEGSRDGEGAVLVLSLDTQCLTDPLAQLEYRLWKEPQGLLDVSWTEGEGGGYIEATATDDVAGARYVHYDLGVRAGSETFYASLELDPNSPDAALGDAGVGRDAGDDDPVDGGGSGGGCHFASQGGGSWVFLLALLVLGLLPFRRRG